MLKSITVFVVTLVLFVTIVNAANLNATEVDEIDADDLIKTDVGTSRIRHHVLPFYGGSALRKYLLLGKYLQ